MATSSTMIALCTVPGFESVNWTPRMKNAIFEFFRCQVETTCLTMDEFCESIETDLYIDDRTRNFDIFRVDGSTIYVHPGCVMSLYKHFGIELPKDLEQFGGPKFWIKDDLTYKRKNAIWTCLDLEKL